MHKGVYMAWFTRFTRFGDVHLVYAQEADNSCGIACVMMTVFKINKLAPGRRALHTEDRIYQVYSRVSGSEYDGSSYTYANHLASTLNQLHVGHWTARSVGAGSVSQNILSHVSTFSALSGPTIFVRPMIVLIGWKAGGAHFVVVDTVRQLASLNYATVCDPWDGDVHVTRFASRGTFPYTGRQQPLSWDLGGTKHSYGSGSSGRGNGWIIYRDS
jgi:hypothetical protein